LGVGVALVVGSILLASIGCEREASAPTGELIAVAKHGTLEEAEALVAAGADVNEADELGWTALHYAINRTRFGDFHEPDLVLLFLESGGDLEARTAEEETALHIAARIGNVTLVESFLDAGSSIDVVEDRGRTPTSLAAFMKRLQVLDLLTSRGADLNLADSNGWTPLHFAAFRDHEEIAALLIARGADVNAASGPVGSPLHVAARYSEQPPLVNQLIRAESSLSGVNVNGETPLHVAVIYGNVGAAQALLAAGADPAASRPDGATPTSLAQIPGNEAIAKLVAESEPGRP
jgi:ankyrin repeat protein